MNCSKRILAFFLVLTLVVQVLPLSVFAEASNSARATEQEIVSEETPGAEEETPAEETSTLQIANNSEEASEEAAAVPDDLNSDSSDETVSGNCGEDLSWEFSPKSGTLTIMGSGKMSNYDDFNQTSPWSAYASQIQSVEFPEGLTGIGNYAFAGCSALREIQLPEHLESIGSYAFRGCAELSGELVIPDGVRVLNRGAFSGLSKISSLVLGDRKSTRLNSSH